MPYYLAVYDVGVKRNAKMLKLFRRYLHWVQNSVFEGELTRVQFDALRGEATALMDPEHDGVIFYELRAERYVGRTTLGVDQANRDRFL